MHELQHFGCGNHETAARSHVDSTAPLQREDWDFTEVPVEELTGCCYWEYARESAFIRSTLQGYRDWWVAGGKRSAEADHLFKNLDKIQSVGSFSKAIVSGCCFEPGATWQGVDSSAKNFRHKDAPPITGSFPGSWQSLAQDERAYRARLARYGDGVLPTPIQRGDFHEAEEIGKYCQSKWTEILSAFHEVQRQNPGKTEVQLRADGKLGAYEEVLPSLFWESGREVTVLRIAWEYYTNDDLVRAFRLWVKSNRPSQIPAPSNRGHKPGDLRAHLTRLAVMRLLSRFKISELLNPRGQDSRPVLDHQQFRAVKWNDATKWHDARRQAGRFFRQLFPYLPADEQPLRWNRHIPGK